MNPITDEQQKDINDRVEEFKKRHRANVAELQADFIALPDLAQLPGQAIFGISIKMDIIDTKYLPVPSPLNAEDIT